MALISPYLTGLQRVAKEHSGSEGGAGSKKKSGANGNGGVTSMPPPVDTDRLLRLLQPSGPDPETGELDS